MVADFREVTQSKNIRDKVSSQVNAKWKNATTRVTWRLIRSASAVRRDDLEEHLPQVREEDNTERNLSSLTRSGIVHVSDTGIPLNSTPTGKYSESSYQKSQRSMKASQDVKLSNTPPKTVKFDDGIENLTETKKKVEALLHKPRANGALKTRNS